MKLISMTDFVSKYIETGCAVEQIKRMHRYKDFLLQPLKLEMFIPCDEEGNLMSMEKAVKDEDYALNYCTAQEKVLFEGFEVCTCNSELSVRKKNRLPLMKSEMENMTVEDLVKGNLILTPSAIKQIGLWNY